MDLNKIRSLVAELQVELGKSEPNTPAEVATPMASTSPYIPTGYPRIEMVGNVRMKLKAPLNSSWYGSSSDYVFGGQDGAGTYLADPSNSDGTVPFRSPAGYPLMYGVELGGAMSTRTPPRVSFAGQTHASDAAVEAWKVASGVRDANLARNDANVDTAGTGFPIFTSEKRDALLAEFNNGIAGGRPDLAWHGITAAEQYALQNLGMTRDEISRMVSQYNTGAPPSDYHASTQKVFRESDSPLLR